MSIAHLHGEESKVISNVKSSSDHALSGVVVGELLYLGSNSFLFGMALGALFTRVQEIGISLGDMVRIVDHLGADVRGGLLEVLFFGEARLLSWIERCSGCCGGSGGRRSYNGWSNSGNRNSCSV